MWVDPWLLWVSWVCLVVVGLWLWVSYQASLESPVYTILRDETLYIQSTFKHSEPILNIDDGTSVPIFVHSRAPVLSCSICPLYALSCHTFSRHHCQQLAAPLRWQHMYRPWHQIVHPHWPILASARISNARAGLFPHGEISVATRDRLPVPRYLVPTPWAVQEASATVSWA